MDTADPLTRRKVALSPSIVGAKSTVLPHLLLTDVLLALALHSGKVYLLSADLGVFWVLVRVLACGAVGIAAWTAAAGQLRKKSIEWSVVGMSSLLLFLRQACLFTALYRLPSTRVIVVTHFSAIWFKSLLNPTSLARTSAIVFALLVSFLSDTGFATETFREMIPAYGSLALEALSSTALEHTQGVLTPALGRPMTAAMSTLGAFVFSLPWYMLRHVLTDASPPPFVPLMTLSVIPFLAYVLLFEVPKSLQIFNSPSTPPRFFLVSNISTFAASVLFGVLLFGQYPSLSDFLVASLLLYGSYPRPYDPTAGSPFTSTSRMARTYLKSILSNPESRKIFYFLMLNMCYMLVQMLYGVWTNSLGLISDAIHMAFDCMAIGVGLIASVMARWPPNERFTYGYVRIESLSGFANGIFLILISLFIVFEAIQRLLDPPEMNTSQLLLVSSLGLGVNLFGMFAMGGHHHGGHSHSHSHGHDHSHAPFPSQSALRHDHHYGHSHVHVEDRHSHSRSHPHQDSNSHSHSHTHTHDHTESHSHSHSHSHSPPHSHSPEPASTSPPPPHIHSHTDEPVIHINGINGETAERRVPVRAHRHSRRASHHVHSDGVAQELSIAIPPVGIFSESPLTPNYEFGHDKHYETHHGHHGHIHTPNLHDHSHVHDHHGHEGHSHNMRGVFLHVMADTLGSVGVIVSTLLIQFYGWTGFDPIASLFIAVLIAASVIPLVIDTGKVLALDLADREISIEQSLSEVGDLIDAV
ncbi:hypothetical protein AcV5_009391 [Taiwanofungus camphoratus]|nr:hypothetical protein AcV5_009391 [Antrodia cinnamomea]